MGRLIVTEFMTLDGVAQAPGGIDEDREGGFDHGGWQAPLPEPAAGNTVFEQAATMDALLLGRKTYDIFAEYWPKASPDIPFTALLNEIPKYVASTTLTEPLGWNASTLLTGDIVQAVGDLKQQHDEVHVIGSLDLVQSLLRHGLVDHVRLWVYPLVLGTGKRVFAGGAVPAALELVESTVYPNGTAHLCYDFVGRPGYADMDPTMSE